MRWRRPPVVTPIREQIILITGSTDGLGKATALEFAARGAIVLIHGRSAERIEATLGEIATATGKPKGQGYCADLADLRQVRRLAREVVGGQTRLDLLINNAGIGAGNMDKPRRETSVDGYELRFAVNYLSHFHLTLELVPLLEAGAPSRIVNVASVGQEALDF